MLKNVNTSPKIEKRRFCVGRSRKEQKKEKRRQKKLFSKQNSVAKERGRHRRCFSLGCSSQPMKIARCRQRAAQAAFYNKVPKSGKSHKIPEISVVGVVAVLSQMYRF
jgi:hypothetical protein